MMVEIFVCSKRKAELGTEFDFHNHVKYVGQVLTSLLDEKMET